MRKTRAKSPLDKATTNELVLINMRRPHPTLTPQELAIMKVVWRLESATVRLSHWRWKNASKAASFAPQRSRQSDSPTDQERKLLSAIGKKKITTICADQSQVTCWRDITPQFWPCVEPAPTMNMKTTAHAIVSVRICRPRRTPSSPS